jgi:hypothetical protein
MKVKPSFRGMKLGSAGDFVVTSRARQSSPAPADRGGIVAQQQGN